MPSPENDADGTAATTARSAAKAASRPPAVNRVGPFRNALRRLRARAALRSLVKRTLGATAAEQAARLGEAPFCLFEGESISFAEFNRRANRCANFFRAEGVAPGEVVCLLMENRPEFLTIWVGLAKLGAVTAAINTNQRGEALAHSLNLSGAARLVAGTECLAQLREVRGDLERIGADGIYVERRWEEGGEPPAGSRDLNALLPAQSDAEPPEPALNGRNLLMYIFTSGTTGLPKAAKISHLRWHFVGEGIAEGLSLGPGDRVFCALPLYHSNAALIAFGAALVSGVGLALSRRFSASRYWEEVSRTESTCFIYIGELLRYLVNTPAGAYDRRHKVTRILGNGLRGDIWEAFQERFGIPVIREFYASSEGNLSTVNTDNRPGSVGKPSALRPHNLALVRCDPATGEYERDNGGFLVHCQPGEVGELLGEITLTSPFAGYTSEADSEEKRLRNAFRPGDVYFRTGDLLSQDEEGYFYFIDRIGDTFRWKGENVSTEEVQKILGGFEAAALVNVYGVTVPGADGRAGMAALSLSNGAGFDATGFYAYVEQHLAQYARPAFVRVCPHLEVTTTFKLRKPELQNDGFDPARVADPLFYRDAAARTYQPLDERAMANIADGKLRF